MTVTISLTDLAVGILVICGIVLAVYLIITLIRVNRTLNNINAMLEANRRNVDDTMKSLPAICDNVNSITKSVKEKTDILDQYGARDGEEAAGIDIQGIITGVTAIVDLFSEIKDYFTSGRRRR